MPRAARRLLPVLLALYEPYQARADAFLLDR